MTLSQPKSVSFQFENIDLVDIDFSRSLPTVVERWTTNLHPLPAKWHRPSRDAFLAEVAFEEERSTSSRTCM